MKVLSSLWENPYNQANQGQEQPMMMHVCLVHIAHRWTTEHLALYMLYKSNGASLPNCSTLSIEVHTYTAAHWCLAVYVLLKYQ